MDIEAIREKYNNREYNHNIEYGKKLPENYVFDEELSVKCNREMVAEHNARVEVEKKEAYAKQAELEKKLSSASKESVRKKLEISQKLNELDELRRTVDAIPDEVIRAYTAQKYVHHSGIKQEI